MRLADEAEFFPSACAVTGRGDGPFVDFQAHAPWVDPHVYIRQDIVREAAVLLGMVEGSELEAARAEIARLEDKVSELDNEVRELGRFVDAVDVLESREFRARKKPGRPRKEPVNA